MTRPRMNWPRFQILPRRGARRLLGAREGARCWAVGVCTSTSVQSFAAAAAPQLGFPTSTFTPSTPCPGQPSGFQIAASYKFQFVAKGYFPVNPTLTAKACFQ